MWFSVFLTKKSQVMPLAFLAKIRLFHNSVHFFIAVVDNFCYTERQNQNEMCLRGRQLSWRTEYQKGNRELFFCLKICRKKPSCIGGTCKKGAPFDGSGRIFVLFSAIPQFPRLFLESYPQAVDNPVYNFCELWIFCGWKKYGLHQKTEISIFSGLCKISGLFFHTAVYKKWNVLSIHREKTGDCGQMKKLSTASEHRIFEKEM